ncbi:MAG TPA: ABC transporter permease [Vicinamibacterales bacterium]|nr:ABC transporter permease [Vicinamibacterales bacterium]
MSVRNIQLAIRGLWHAKGFAAVAGLCLSLGIGLNTTIFSIVDGVLLKPFPYTEPDRLVQVVSINQPIGVTEGGISYADLRDLAPASTFVGMGGTQGRSLTLTDGANPERFLGAGVSWNLFPLMGVVPALGPGFRAEDDVPGAPATVILSDALWRTRYNADPGIVGRSITIDSVPTTVVGVMPERFEFPQSQKLWLPISRLADPRARDARGMFVIGRLAPGVTLEHARAELVSVTTRLADEYPDSNRDWIAGVLTLREALIPDQVTLVIWLMMAGVTLVLFIACSNVANLLLARASARRREMAVRTALGASRGQIVRQLLIESVVLALVAVPFGLLLAEVGTRLIYGMMPVDQVPYYITWDVDARSRAWAVFVAASTAVLFGLFPALQATRGSLHDDLKEGTRGNSARRSLLRSGLVVAQVSLALVALVGALMFVQSFRNLDGYDVGFDPAPLVTLRIAMPNETYGGEDARARRVQDILERVEALSGVEAAFASNMVPLQAGGGGGRVIVDGRPSEPGREPFIDFIGVTPHYLRTLGVTVAEGSDFSETDGWTRTDVAIVNRTMAERFWPNRSAVGGRFRLVDGDASPVWFTAVGVVEDVQTDNIDPGSQPSPAAYVSYLYQQSLNTGFTVRVAAGDPAAATSALREAIRASDPNLPIFQVATMEELRRLGYWEFALFGWVFGVIGFGGLLLASIGVYGVLSYAVSQRVPEIGVRVALGATPGSVIRLVLGHGLWLAGIGEVVGLVLAPILTWTSRSFFYDLSPFDPFTFVSVALFLLAVATVASLVPALRATRIDPLVALRDQ